MSAQQAVMPPRTIARRGRAAIFLGLSWGGIGLALFGALVLFVVVVGIAAPAIGIPLALVAGAIGIVRISGRPLYGWLPILATYVWRNASGHTRFARNLQGPRVEGTLGLPGDGARLRLVIDEHGTAFVHDPHTKFLTATLRVTHGGAALLDPAKQGELDSGWGSVLDAMARFDDNVSRIQVIERTLPGGGGLLQQYMRDKSGALVDSPLGAVYESLVAKQGESLRHESLIAITLDLGKGSSRIREMGGGLQGAVGLAREVMITLQGAVPEAGLTSAGWLTEGDLALLIRSVYDPAAISRLSSASIGRQVATSGPMGVSEGWSTVQSDSAVHKVFQITEWPRSEIGPMSLWPLILSPGVHRTFTLIAKPIPVGKSRREAKVNLAETRQDRNRRRQKRGWDDPEDAAEEDQAAKRLAEVTVFGSREFEFIGLVVVHAPDEDTLRKEVRKILTKTNQADLDMRPLIGQQAQHLITACLPVGRGL